MSSGTAEASAALAPISIAKNNDEKLVEARILILNETIQNNFALLKRAERGERAEVYSRGRCPKMKGFA